MKKMQFSVRNVVAAVLLILILAGSGAAIRQAVVFAFTLSAARHSPAFVSRERRVDRVVADIEKCFSIETDNTLAEKMARGLVRSAVRAMLQTTWMCAVR